MKSIDSATVISHLAALRKDRPLVHNITNFVVMNSTANALLAIGAAPVMAHAVEEMADLVSIADALVINIGTLDPQWVEGMLSAGRAAREKGIPIVLDPVGAGATPYRTQTALEITASCKPTVLRGNPSEIMALVDSSVKTRGVDSTTTAGTALAAAKELAEQIKSVVVVSGSTDYITDGSTVLTVKNGHPLMARVTGLGCTASSICGAFSASVSDALHACASAMAVMGICGEIAAEKSDGPGTLQLHFLDALYNLDTRAIEAHYKN